MALNRDQVIEKVDNLYRFRDLYIDEHTVAQASQKPKDVEKKMKEVLRIVDDNQTSLSSKAEYFMLKGKCLNVTSDYDNQAEEALSKSVKLDPKQVEAWNVLGECFWKKGDIEQAKNCFTGALQHSINKISLRNLSMVLRQFGSTPEEKLQHINESVKKAKEAVEMDMNDGTSWFILGNAYLAVFFAGTQSEGMIKQCMKAYSFAEKDAVARNNPDLHFNRAMCLLYQSDFKASLEGFMRAAALDPSWDVPSSKVHMLTSYLNSCFTMVNTKCGMTGKAKLQKLMSGINNTQLGPYGGGSYTSPAGKTINLEEKVFNQLAEGANSNAVVCGKVIGTLSADTAVPYTFALVDKDSNCIIVCLYNLSTSYGFKTGDSVAIPEPYIMQVDLEHSDRHISYRTIRVETPIVLVVNGRKLGLDKQAPAVLKMTTQSE